MVLFLLLTCSEVLHEFIKGYPVIHVIIGVFKAVLKYKNNTKNKKLRKFHIDNNKENSRKFYCKVSCFNSFQVSLWTMLKNTNTQT